MELLAITIQFFKHHFRDNLASWVLRTQKLQTLGGREPTNSRLALNILGNISLVLRDIIKKSIEVSKSFGVLSFDHQRVHKQLSHFEFITKPAMVFLYVLDHLLVVFLLGEGVDPVRMELVKFKIGHNPSWVDMPFILVSLHLLPVELLQGVRGCERSLVVFN